MDLPVALMADSVTEGNIYFFTEECPIGVADHMHVCIKKADEVLIFSTCSSQIDTALRLAQLRGWDLNTFPVRLFLKISRSCFNRLDYLIN